MKRMLFILCVLLLIVGCGETKTEVVKKPFSCAASDFEYMKGECCQDLNNNNICDKDDHIKKEVAIIKEAIQPEPKPLDLGKSWCEESKTVKARETIVITNPGKKIFNDLTFSACLKTVKDDSDRIKSQRWYDENQDTVVEEKFQFGVFVSREVYWIDDDGHRCHEFYDRKGNQVEHICE